MANINNLVSRIASYKSKLDSPVNPKDPNSMTFGGVIKYTAAVTAFLGGLAVMANPDLRDVITETISNVYHHVDTYLFKK